MNELNIKVWAASPRLALANPAVNAERQAEAAAKAAAGGARFIVFPAMSLTGATCGDLFKSARLKAKTEEALRTLTEKTAELDAVIVTGLPKDGKSVAAVIYKGKYQISEGGRVTGFAPFDFMVKIGNSQDKNCSGNCGSLAAYLDARQMRAGDGRVFPYMISALSKACGSTIVYANANPGESTAGAVYAGDCIIAENGRIIAYTAPLQRNGSSAAAVIGAGAPMVIEPKPFYRFDPADPFIPAGGADEYCNEIFETQAVALAERLQRAYSKKAILGVSGGSDSTLAILVSARAMELLGRDPADVLAVTMPGFGTSSRTKGNAYAMMEALGCEIREISIAASVSRHFEDIGQDPDNHDVTYENAQARERTQILMDLSNKDNGMVVGTGDMSESALGWCTYNGDHMAMYSVNCGLTKGLVKKTIEVQAKKLRDGTTAFGAYVDREKLAACLEDVLDTPVSPELLPTDSKGNIAQITEDKVGPYELHDFFLYHMVVDSMDPDEILNKAEDAFKGRYDRETIAKWLRTFCRRFFTQQFKRSCSPEGPQLVQMCLSPRGVWDMPSDADGSIWQELDI